MSQARENQPIEVWAERLANMGLTPIVVPMLELARPLGFIVSQLMLLGEPLLVGANGTSSFRQTAEWFEDPENVDHLLARLLDE